MRDEYGAAGSLTNDTETVDTRGTGLLDQSAPPADGVVMCGSKDGLAGINDAGTELVIWQRALPEGLHDWLEQADAANLPYIRILVEPGDLRPALEPLLDECGLPADDMRDLLIDDIGGLVSAFAGITGIGRVDVRLERINHDSCWRFHRDTVETRLVTTYRGPTTEWVQPADADRAISEQREYDGPMERLGDHDVAIFNGKWAGPDRGIVHRSPPIAGTGVTRLLLCLNKRTVVSPEPWVKA